MSHIQAPIALQFDFSQSCNCCFPRRRPKDDVPAYVNSKYKVEKFNVKKADSIEKSMSRSYNHIMDTLQTLGELLQWDDDKLIREIEKRADVQLDPMPNEAYTFGEIVRIQNVIGRIYAQQQKKYQEQH